MCTSVAIGFYIRDEERFREFKVKVTEMSKDENSIFSAYMNKPKYEEEMVVDQ